ncbi:MAG: HYR domain-containing protein, partial [Bacteroidales bacterium]|nr:HYR domain-containing protein [Bacteroidales bacterium]
MENEKQFCCITGSLAHPKYSLNNTEYNLNYENKIRFLPLIISDYTKERGINPINGPPGQVPDHKTESLLYRQTEITHPHSFSTDQVTDNNINMSDSIEQYPVTILCPPDISIYTDINTCTSYITDKLNAFYERDNATSVTWEMEGATEGRSPLTGFNKIDDFTFNEGATIITYTITDLRQNRATCSFTVTISDNQVPRFINFPGNISVYTEPGKCDAVVNWNMPGITDNCTPPDELIWTASHQPGSRFSEGITEVRYSVTDGIGNRKDTSFFITVIDNEPPVLSNCPVEINISTDPGLCEASVTWIEPTVIDNCSEASAIFLERSHEPGSIFPTGSTPVTYKFIDEAGNIAECMFNITIIDNETPLLLPPADISLFNDETLPAPFITLSEFSESGGFAADNCKLDESTFRLISETGISDICPYTITRVYSVADMEGNITTAGHHLRVLEEEINLKSGQGFLVNFTAMQSGLWSEKATWGGLDPPSAADDVTIPAGVTVTIDIAAFCKNMEIQNGGTVNYSGAQTLQVHGNWTDNGNYDGGTSGGVEFAGNEDSYIDGTTTFEEQTITKESLATTLTINGNTTISGGGSLTLNGGLIKIPGGASLSCEYSMKLKIPPNSGFEVNGRSLRTGKFSITNNGLIRVTSGTANFGTNSGNSVHTQVDGAFIVTEGTVKIAGRLENTARGTLDPLGLPSGITVSGGEVILSAVGNGLSNTGSLNVTSNGYLDFTGGSIVFQNPSTAGTTLDLGLLDGYGTKNTDGGVFQFGNNSTPDQSEFIISSVIPLNNITSASDVNLKLKSDLEISDRLDLADNSNIILDGNSIRLKVDSKATYNLPLSDTDGNSIPVSVEIADGTISPESYIELKTIGNKHPENLNEINYLERYWSVSTGGINNPEYNITAKYANTDIIGDKSGLVVTNFSDDSWSPLENTNLGPNTILINGVNGDLEFTAFAEATVTITASPATTVCSGSPVTLTAVVMDGTAQSYTWSSNPSGIYNKTQAITVSPTQNTTYSVTIVDENSITVQSDPITISVNPLPTATISGSITVCQNAAQPQITFTGTNGSAPYTFTYNINGSGSYSTVSTGNTANVNVPTNNSGTFTCNLISVEDNNGCLQNQTGSATVTVTPPISATADITDPIICYGEGATVEITATGGTPPYTFSFEGKPSNSTGVFTGIVAGTNYDWTVTDALGCDPETGTITVTQP